MTRNTRPLTLLVLVGVAIARVYAQSAPPADPKIIFKVAIPNNQREFHIGETIPLQLSFSSTVKNRYQINMAQYDRSGRMNYERFVVSPAHSAVDPLPPRMGFMGGLTSFKFRGSEPWTIKLNLNEWVRFTQPGEYRLKIVSRRITARDPTSSLGVSSVTARSDEIRLKIVAADPVWQKQVFNDAVKTLNKPGPSKPEQMEQFPTARRHAAETLPRVPFRNAADRRGSLRCFSCRCDRGR
jgi:hypothetical protein